jgi:glutamate racemase
VEGKNRNRRVQANRDYVGLIPVGETDLQSRPIGVFDSGVGGLSVLRALHAELPHEQFVYVADSAHAPYGERDDTHILDRSHAIADHLIAQHNIKALVMACNTATASAISRLRGAYPDLPIVGIEPAVKPAAAQTATGTVTVMATRGTLQSEKFGQLLDRLQGQARFRLQACDGLADAIERNHAASIEGLCETYLQALGPFGSEPGQADVLVLGCTHYAFAADVLQRRVGNFVTLLEAGKPVARQTHRQLSERAMLRPALTAAVHPIHTYIATGDTADLQHALARWMDIQTMVLQQHI